MNIKDNKIKAINVSIRNNKSVNKPLLISNLSFSLNEKEKLVVYNSDPVEKDAFLSLFTKKNIKYSGLFDIDGQIINSSIVMQNFARFYSSKIFNNEEDKSKRILEILERTLNSLISNDVKEMINEGNKIDNHLKMYKAYKFKKVEQSYLKATKILINHTFASINELLKKLDNKKLTNEEFIKINQEFFIEYINYLKSRVFLLIEKNIILIDLYIKTYDNKQILSQNYNLSIKAKDLIRKITYCEKFSSKLSKYKKEIMSMFSHSDENISDEANVPYNKLIIETFIEKLKNKYEIYRQCLKSNDLYTNKFEIYKREKICKEFLTILEKEKHNLEFLKESEALEFYWELDLKYKRTLIKKDDFIDVKSFTTKKQFNDYLNKFIKIEVIPIIEEFKRVSRKRKRKRNKDQDATKTQKIETDKMNIKIKTITNNLEIEIKDFFDEINWEYKSLFHNLNNRINIIIKKTNALNEEYSTKKGELDKIVDSFIDKKIKMMNSKFSNIKNVNELTSEYFSKETQKFDVIYKFVHTDNRYLEKMFSKFSKTNKALKDIESYYVIRYMILKKAKEMNITVFDLLSRVGKMSNLLKIKMTFLISNVDNKKIAVFNNLFSSIDSSELDDISKLFNDLSRESKKAWILLEDNLINTKQVACKYLILDKSIQIEYGIAKEIIENSVYDTTKLALGRKDLRDRIASVDFYSLVYSNNDYDYYKINSHHYVFGNIENIYEWTGVIPSETNDTVNPQAIESFKNKLMFEVSNKKLHEVDKFKKEETTSHTNDEESKEFLIIDVH